MHLQVRKTKISVEPKFRPSFHPMGGLEFFNFAISAVVVWFLSCSHFEQIQLDLDVWESPYFWKIIHSSNYEHLIILQDPPIPSRPSGPSGHPSPLFSKRSLDHLISLREHDFNEIRLRILLFFQKLTKIFKNNCPKRRKNWTWVCWFPFHYHWQWRLLATKFES